MTIEPAPGLDSRLRALFREPALVASALMVEAFAQAGEAEQVRVVQTADLGELQTSVRAVLDDLDEGRTATIDRLRTVLVPELEYLLLT